MKMLVQFPTKGRTSKFFETLDLWYSMIGCIDDCVFHIVIDHFDYTMNNSGTLHKLSSYKNLFVSAIPEKPTKIKACNFNIDKFADFDIIILASDDMIPKQNNFGDIVRRNMSEYYPNLDGCLWYNDGNQMNICTMPVMGRKYYDAFGYIYHPSYVTMWADNEYTIVAQKTNKVTYFQNCIVKHDHPCYNPNIIKDQTYIDNDAGQGDDGKVFNVRRLNNFDIR